jgi:hypothetical protein
MKKISLEHSENSPRRNWDLWEAKRANAYERKNHLLRNYDEYHTNILAVYLVLGDVEREK